MDDERRHTTPPDSADDSKRSEALARYDAHPGIAVLLLAAMAFLFIVVTYQWASDRLADPISRVRHVQLDLPKSTSR
jgi:hypothetical protein